MRTFQHFCQIKGTKSIFRFRAATLEAAIAIIRREYADYKSSNAEIVAALDEQEGEE